MTSLFIPQCVNLGLCLNAKFCLYVTAKTKLKRLCTVEPGLQYFRSYLSNEKNQDRIDELQKVVAINEADSRNLSFYSL